MKHIPMGRRKTLDRPAPTLGGDGPDDRDRPDSAAASSNPTDGAGASKSGGRGGGKGRGPGGRGPGDGGPDDPQSKHGTSAIDLFIDRGLHELYDGVVNEPLPDSLLRLIEDDRNK